MFKNLLNFVPSDSKQMFAFACNTLHSQCNFTKVGSIQYQSLTSEYLEDTLSVMRNDFFPNENICKVFGIANDPKSIEELVTLCSEITKDGITIIAVDKATNKVAGTLLNKIQTRAAFEGEKSFFDSFSKNCKHSGSRKLIQYFNEMDTKCNFFDICKVDFLMESMLLATRSQYRRRGIATKLSEICLEVAENLHNGHNIKHSINDTKLTLDPVPQIVSAICTTFKSQAIYKKLGFITVAEDNFNSLIHNGTNFTDFVDKQTTKVVYSYKRL